MLNQTHIVNRSQRKHYYPVCISSDEQISPALEKGDFELGGIGGFMDGDVFVEGVVEAGYGVASGMGVSPYPGGTIALQMPFFRGLGLDLGDCFAGTLNVNVAPFEMRILRPRFRFEGVEWVAGVVETFSFCRCGVEFGAVEYEGWIYFPHPETKPDHFQPPGLVEVIVPRILGLGYGDRVGLRGFGDEVRFEKEAP